MGFLKSLIGMVVVGGGLVLALYLLVERIRLLDLLLLVGAVLLCIGGIAIIIDGYKEVERSNYQ